MDIKVVLDKNGMVPDRYAKHADAAHLHAQKPTTSFPFEVEGIPQGARSLALAFTDYDSIPVCGFTWIHWVAAGIDASLARDGRLAFPEDASNLGSFGMVQGKNSSASSLVGSSDPLLTCRRDTPGRPAATTARSRPTGTTCTRSGCSRWTSCQTFARASGQTSSCMPCAGT